MVRLVLIRKLHYGPTNLEYFEKYILSGIFISFKIMSIYIVYIFYSAPSLVVFRTTPFSFSAFYNLLARQSVCVTRRLPCPVVTLWCILHKLIQHIKAMYWTMCTLRTDHVFWRKAVTLFDETDRSYEVCSWGPHWAIASRHNWQW